jgi:uncharacterized protein
VRRFDLHSLRFEESSEVRRVVPAEIMPFRLGGLEYGVAGGVVEIELIASRVGAHISVTGLGEATLTGVCQRCLAEAFVAVTVACEEYVKGGESEGDDGYTSGWFLDLQSWVRDAIADALPQQILCRDDCLGLCQECGADLNVVGADHVHGAR